LITKAFFPPTPDLAPPKTESHAYALLKWRNQVLGTSEITVIDSLMGLGKTTYILDQLRQSLNPFSDRRKVIVLVPPV
jgi:hypothetical protein